MADALWVTTEIPTDGVRFFDSIGSACATLSGNTTRKYVYVVPPTKAVNVPAAMLPAFPDGVPPSFFEGDLLPVPDFVTVTGFTPGLDSMRLNTDLPNVYFAANGSGNLITLGRDSTVANLAISYVAQTVLGNPMTGDVTMIYGAPGEQSYQHLYNVHLLALVEANSHTLHHIRRVGNTTHDNYLDARRVHMQLTGSPATSIFFESSGGSKCTSYFWDSWFDRNGNTPDRAIKATDSSLVKVYSSKIGGPGVLNTGPEVGGFTVDVEATGGAHVSLDSTPIDTMDTSTDGWVWWQDRQAAGGTMIIADNGIGGTPSDVTLKPGGNVCLLECQNPDGANLTVDTSAMSGRQPLTLIDIGTNSMTLSAAQMENSASAWTSSQWSPLELMYTGSALVRLT